MLTAIYPDRVGDSRQAGSVHCRPTDETLKQVQGDDGVGFEGLESAGKCDFAARTASAADSKLFAQQMTQMARMDACPGACHTDCHNT